MQRATATLKLIDDMIEADQGAKFRTLLRDLLPKMEDAYRGESSPFRSHLGASLIGKECSRELFYSFRWVKRPKFEGRILRLFNRGHLEEARFLAMMEMIGAEIWYETETGGQFKFSGVNGHFGSSLDGVVKGLPDLPEGVPAYAEFKTSAEKPYLKIRDKGVKEAKYQHYVQMQMCMHHMRLSHAVYFVINKNNDEMHAEILTYDQPTAIKHLGKAEVIVYAEEPPPKIAESPCWYQCKFCDFFGVCKDYEVPEINCRTCAHSTVGARDGEWHCARGNDEIHKDAAFDGCSEHVFNPFLLQKVVFHGGDDTKNVVDLTLPSGERLLHGPNNVTSKQLQDKGLK